MRKENKVAVIATVLNEKNKIDQLVENLLSQSICPRQIVIVDGGSNDGTWERLAFWSQKTPVLKVIKDSSCSLRNCPGPIGRGRNRAIEEAEAEIIACADAGCHYNPNWLELLTKPILEGQADYTIGGSCFDKKGQTIWDVAAAPFLGLDLPGLGMPMTPTGTARSLAFTKKIWSEIGGFSERTLCGEDTEFQKRLQKKGKSLFVPEAPAIYLEHFNLRETIERIYRYAQADGLNKLCFGRFLRMLGRSAWGLASLLLLKKYWQPLALYALVELLFALKHDYKGMLAKEYRPYLFARYILSLLVPYLFIYSYIIGMRGRANQKNAQNA